MSSQPPTPWLRPLCEIDTDDMSTCCLGIWLPCVLYSRTQHRLGNLDNTTTTATDPKESTSSSDKTFRSCNTSCMLYAALLALLAIPSGILLGFERSRIRALYDIEGTVFGDFAVGLFCQPCSLIQGDREVVEREALGSPRFGIGGAREDVVVVVIANEPVTRAPVMEYKAVAKHRPSIPAAEIKSRKRDGGFVPFLCG